MKCKIIWLKELSSSRIRMMASSVSSLCNYIENMCDERIS